MFPDLKIRTGMITVLALFIAALLFLTLSSWRAAVTSHDEIIELNSATIVIDGVNNSLLLATRTSANVSSAFIEGMGGHAEDAQARLVRSEGIWAESIAKLNAAADAINDPVLKGMADELKVCFDKFGTAVGGQRAAVRALSAADYIESNKAAVDGMTKLQAVRLKLVGELETRSKQIIVQSVDRLKLAQTVAVTLGVITLAMAILCWVFIATRVLRPLRDAGQHFRRIAGGDLTQPVTVSGRNENWPTLRRASAHANQPARHPGSDHRFRYPTGVSCTRTECDNRRKQSGASAAEPAIGTGRHGSQRNDERHRRGGS